MCGAWEAWWKLTTFLSVSRVSRQCNGVGCAWLIPATAIVLRGVKCIIACGLQGAPREAVISKVPAYKQSNYSIITIFITF